MFRALQAGLDILKEAFGYTPHQDNMTAGAIFEVIHNNPGMGTDQIQQYMDANYGVDAHTVAVALHRLEEKGALQSSPSSYGQVLNWDTTNWQATPPEEPNYNIADNDPD